MRIIYIYKITLNYQTRDRTTVRPRSNNQEQSIYNIIPVRHSPFGFFNYRVGTTCWDYDQSNFNKWITIAEYHTKLCKCYKYTIDNIILKFGIFPLSHILVICINVSCFFNFLLQRHALLKTFFCIYYYT